MLGFWEKYGVMLCEAILQHLGYVAVSISIAIIVAISVACLLSRFRKAAGILLPLISIFQTIPGIVFIGILMMYTGMTVTTAILALSCYAIFPILKNAYEGLVEVDAGLLEVAAGCGMSRMQILFQVEIPMAMPAIFAGIRLSVIYTVSWAILAAMIGQGGLGEFIYRGIDANVKEYIVIGSIPIAVLAILLRILVDKIEKLVVSKGIRQEPVKR